MLSCKVSSLFMYPSWKVYSFPYSAHVKHNWVELIHNYDECLCWCVERQLVFGVTDKYTGRLDNILELHEFNAT